MEDKENEGWKRLHGTEEEIAWRIKVLKRMARLNAAKAKELERMAKADASMPSMDRDSLFEVLKRIDNVMEWRFVDAPGEVVLDADILAESIDCETLRTLRQCVIQAIADIEQAEREAESYE